MWFVGVLVVHSRVRSNVTERPLIDLQYRIIHAVDPEAAYARVLELGQQAGQSYRNAAGEDVIWEFMGLHDLREVDDENLSDGTEVYAQVVRDESNSLVVPKGRLSVFWAEANKDRTARELLESE